MTGPAPTWRVGMGVLGDGVLLLLVALAVPLAIIVIGAPIALVVRLLTALFG
jgi:hypothetical protein